MMGYTYVRFNTYQQLLLDTNDHWKMLLPSCTDLQDVQGFWAHVDEPMRITKKGVGLSITCNTLAKAKDRFV